MARVVTELFTIEIPELFEKVLHMGPLVRAERMDRAPGERSFAELNLYVGRAADERLGLDAGASAEAIAEGLWRRHLEKEGQLTVVEKAGEGGRIAAVLELPEDVFRPASRQVVEMRGFAASQPSCLSSFVFEYDAALEATYRPLADGMLASLQWRTEPFDEGQLARQAAATWSIFDGMSPERLDALRRRYFEIVQPRARDREPAREAPCLDLAQIEPSELSGEVHKRVGRGPATFRVRAPAFAKPIELDLDAEGFEALPELTRMLEHLAAHGDEDRAQAGAHAWAHCQLCFDVTDYGAPEGQSNQDYFGIRGPEQAWSQLGPGSIYIGDDPDDARSALFGVQFYPPWEDEHGCVLVVKDGRFVGWTDGGGSLLAFEGD
ncbi:MAG: hypothetical protein AAFZ18_01035 [Myxococcota bacterium]